MYLNTWNNLPSQVDFSSFSRLSALLNVQNSMDLGIRFL